MDGLDAQAQLSDWHSKRCMTEKLDGCGIHRRDRDCARLESCCARLKAVAMMVSLSIVPLSVFSLSISDWTNQQATWLLVLIISNRSRALFKARLWSHGSTNKPAPLPAHLPAHLPDRLSHPPLQLSPTIRVQHSTQKHDLGNICLNHCLSEQKRYCIHAVLRKKRSFEKAVLHSCGFSIKASETQSESVIVSRSLLNTGLFSLHNTGLSRFYDTRGLFSYHESNSPQRRVQARMQRQDNTATNSHNVAMEMEDWQYWQWMKKQW